jgi:hypothetical protein
MPTSARRVKPAVDEGVRPRPDLTERRRVVAGIAEHGRCEPGSHSPTIFGFVVTLVLSVWWLLALRFPFLLFGSGADVVAWGSAMDRLYPVLAIFQVLALLGYFLRLTGSPDDRFRRAIRVALAVNGVVFLYLLVTLDHQWVVWRAAAGSRAGLRGAPEIAGLRLSLVDVINYAFSIPFIFVASVSVVRAGRGLVHWLSGGGPRAARV